jgi:hypothetical protein
MTRLIQNALILFASREEMHRVWGRFDHERPGINPNQVVIGIAAIAAAVVAGIVWHVIKRRASRTYSSDSSTKLFRELCAAHGMTRADRRLLRQLAEARGATNPATLFIEPRYFDVQNLPGELRPFAKELRALNETLFG